MDHHKNAFISSFALLSLTVIIFGSWTGSTNIVKNKINSYFSQAQSQVCDYESAAQIFIDGKIAKNIPGFSYKSQQYFKEGSPTPSVSDFAPKNGIFPENPRKAGELESYWKPDGGLPSNFQGKFAQVELKLPPDYVLDGPPFCEGKDKHNQGSDPCQDVFVNFPETIRNIPLRCGVSIEYGWQVKHKDQNPEKCEYFAEVNVVHREIENGQVVNKPLTKAENNGQSLSIINNKGQENSLSEEKAEWKFYNENFTFGPYNKPDDVASVTLKGLDTTKWRVVSTHCSPRPSNPALGCEKGTYSTGDKLTIENFHVACGVDITYGWVVERIPSSTPTPTLTPRPTTQPTNIPRLPTPTPEQIIKCNESVDFEGEIGTHTMQANLGSYIGDVTLKYDSYGIPDRFRVEFEGNEVINTGFRGDEDFDYQLNALGYPGVVGPHEGTEFFNKYSSTTTAKIHVDAPLLNTAWKLTLSCPGSPITLDSKLDPDVDNNGVVNALDYIIVTKNYTKQVSEKVVMADVNRDGSINGQDTSAVIGRFGYNIKN